MEYVDGTEYAADHSLREGFPWLREILDEGLQKLFPSAVKTRRPRTVTSVQGDGDILHNQGGTAEMIPRPCSIRAGTVFLFFCIIKER